MKREKSKSKFVGVRISEEQNQALSRLQKNSSRSKSDILMRGLELLSEYYSLGLNQPDMNTELRNLETEALHHAEAIRQIRKKEEAINQMVQELHNVEKILDKYHGDKNALIQILLGYTGTEPLAAQDFAVMGCGKVGHSLVANLSYRFLL